MQITLQKIENKEAVKPMLFQYFNEIDKSKIVTTDKGKKVNYPYLDTYWIDENRDALYILFNNEIAGFCLINDWVICKDFQAKKAIAEFYIKPNFRKKGIGRQVAHNLFDKHKGKWEIRPAANNKIAIQFWRSVIEEYTGVNYEEITMNDNGGEQLVLLFDSSNKTKL